MITIENYREAQQTVKDHRVCGNGGVGCGKLFRTEDVIRTVQYAQEYHWCKVCYEKIKNDD